MKVPNNLLKAASGKPTSGVALFAVLLMALASVGGAIWGIYAKFATPDGIKACPGKTVGPAPRASFQCEACGMG